jgi:hypothetical protein
MIGGMIFIIILTLGYWIQYMPVFIQYPYYKFFWKKQALILTKNLHPLMAYPMAIFIEFNLDAHFKRGGIRQAARAIEEEGDRQQAVINATLSAMANSKTA